MKKSNNIIMLAIVSLLGILGCDEDEGFIEPLPEHPDVKDLKDAFGEDKFWESYMDDLASFMSDLEEKYGHFADFHAQCVAVLSVLRHPKEHITMPPDKDLYPELVRKIGYQRKPLTIFSYKITDNVRLVNILSRRFLILPSFTPFLRCLINVCLFKL